MKLMRIGPAGAERPALRTDASEVLDVSGLTADINGAFLSANGRHMVLEPGDVINTGTPAGVALGLPGNPYLRAGDTVTVAIGGLGTQNKTFAEA